MTPYQARLTPTVKRMAEDMRVRNMAQATIDAYTYHVDKFERFHGKSVTELGQEEIHRYQLYLVDDKKVSWSQFNQADCGLRFLYETTLGKSWMVLHIPFGKRVMAFTQRKAQNIQFRNLSPRTVEAVAYHVDRFGRHPQEQGPKLVRALRISIVDGHRTQLRVEPISSSCINVSREHELEILQASPGDR